MTKIKSGMLIRKAMSDEIFITSTALQVEYKREIVATRNTMGRLCEIDPRLLYPTDSMFALIDLMWSGWDLWRFSICLQLEINCEFDEDIIQVPDFVLIKGKFLSRGEPKSLAQWIGEFATILRRKERSERTSEIQ